MEKITAANIKLIKFLSTSKGRRENGLFAVERTKIVKEMLKSRFSPRMIVATLGWYEEHPDVDIPKHLLFKASPAEMERMSSMKSAPDVIALFELPSREKAELKAESLYIALDDIQDPGNLGTIIRLADWFGVDTVFTSSESASCYNPKTIMASMGSIARVKVIECDLEKLLQQCAALSMNVWGTFLEGESIYSIPPSTSPTGIIVMGNEGRGISASVASLVKQKISIPSYPPGHEGAESLNVAMATSIVLAEFRRRSLKS